MKKTIAITLALGSALPIAGSAQTAAVFAPCSACHAVKAGGVSLGPTLYRIYGRGRGKLPGYAFSPALKAQKGVWNDAALSTFLTKPQAAIAGTKMAYPGMPDPASRAAMIAYLKTLK